MPDLSPANYRLLSDFRHVLRQFLAFSEERAAQLGLTPQQHQALLAIKGFVGAPSIGDLAARLVIRHNSAVGLVDRLQGAGLIERRSDVQDRRRSALMLTRRGHTLLRQLTNAHRRELRRLSPSLIGLLQALSG